MTDRRKRQPGRIDPLCRGVDMARVADLCGCGIGLALLDGGAGRGVHAHAGAEAMCRVRLRRRSPPLLSR